MFVHLVKPVSGLVQLHQDTGPQAEADAEVHDWGAGDLQAVPRLQGKMSE